MQFTASAPASAPTTEQWAALWSAVTARFFVTDGADGQLMLHGARDADRTGHPVPGVRLTGRELGRIGSTYAVEHPQLTWATLTAEILNDTRRPVAIRYAERDRPGRATATFDSLERPDHVVTDGELPHLRWQGRARSATDPLLSGTVDLDWLHLAVTATMEDASLQVELTVQPRGVWTILLAPTLFGLRGQLTAALGEQTSELASLLTRVATTDPDALVAELDTDDSAADTTNEFRYDGDLEELFDTRWLRSPWTIWSFIRRMARHGTGAGVSSPSGR